MVDIESRGVPTVFVASAEFEVAARAQSESRGADLWHIACALHLDSTAQELAFVTLDGPQRKVAAAAGFTTPH